jgi:hypothetical protein
MNYAMEVQLSRELKQQPTNMSSGVAGCLAIEPMRAVDPEENVFCGRPRPKKAEVTGKVTGCGERAPCRAVLREEVRREAYEADSTAGKQQQSKEETGKQYREALQAQVAAKKHALMLAKENQSQGTGLQLESMHDIPVPQESQASAVPDRARAIQLYNQQMALQKRQDRMAERLALAPAPRPEPMDVESSDKAAVRQQVDADVQAHQAMVAEDKMHKQVLAQNLKAALEAQMRENEARRAKAKQERRNPAQPYY